MRKQTMSLIRPLVTLLIALEFIGCGSLPPPKGEECFVNQKSSYMLCFDFEKDYNQDGTIKSTSKGVHRPIDIQGYSCNSPDTRASVKAFALKYKQRCESKGSND